MLIANVGSVIDPFAALEQQITVARPWRAPAHEIAAVQFLDLCTKLCALRRVAEESFQWADAQLLRCFVEASTS